MTEMLEPTSKNWFKFQKIMYQKIGINSYFNYLVLLLSVNSLFSHHFVKLL